jgi:multidrug transporter EmrE-like cation transporter
MSPLSWGWLIFCSLAVVIGNVLLRIGIDRSGVSLFSGRGFTVCFDRSQVLSGSFISLFYSISRTAMLVWFRLVSTERLSVAYPVLAALSFIGVTVVGTLIFAEPFSAQKAAGLISIVIGLYLVSIA